MITSKQVPVATNQHATTDELFEAVFSMVHAALVAMQGCGKHVSTATV
jgi:hypothetical protein